MWWSINQPNILKFVLKEHNKSKVALAGNRWFDIVHFGFVAQRLTKKIGFGQVATHCVSPQCVWNQSWWPKMENFAMPPYLLLGVRAIFSQGRWSPATRRLAGGWKRHKAKCWMEINYWCDIDVRTSESEANKKSDSIRWRIEQL